MSTRMVSGEALAAGISKAAGIPIPVSLQFPSPAASSQRLTHRGRSGLSQVEVVVSTIIVGVLMVASFSTIAASRRSQMSESNEVRGLAIAEALMAEITQLPMREPSCDCGFGIEAGEAGSNRSNYDDVDDYQNLVDSPPKSRSGTACVGYTDLSRSVAIDMVATTDWSATSATYVGVYRITVKVLRGTQEVCRLVGYRTSGSQGSSAAASSLN